MGRLALAVAPLLGVALLRLAAPIALDGDFLPAWVAVAAPGVVAGMLALAAAALLAAGLRTTHAATAVEAMIVGSIGIGLAIVSVAALRAPDSLPGPALAVAAAAAGVLAVVWVLLPDPHDRGSRVRLALASFAVFEVVLASGIFLAADAASLASPLLAAGGLAVLASIGAAWADRRADRDGFRGGLLLAGSLGALAFARTGSADAVAGLTGLLALAVVSGWEGIAVLRSAWTTERQPPVVASPMALLASPALDLAEPEDDAAVDDAARLARELHGTIEELLAARRIIELQRTEISRAAVVDTLTGTATRRAILERLAVEVAEARRYSHPIAVLLLDIDGFRDLNREHGLAVADAILGEVGLRMRLRLRAADALGRVGADSFLAILPHTDERGAAEFAHVLLERLRRRPVATDAGELALRASIGVALMRPGMEVSDEGLLVAADEALGSARASGGNRIAFDRLHGLARLDDRRG